MNPVNKIQAAIKQTLIDMDIYREETQLSICLWANETFGVTTPAAAQARAVKEMNEFENLITKETIQDEAADIIITLYRVAQEYQFDLMQAVDLKMRVNRGRKWKVSGDGTGQHE
jgi:hypothetical protein